MLPVALIADDSFYLKLSGYWNFQHEKSPLFCFNALLDVNRSSKQNTD